MPLFINAIDSQFAASTGSNVNSSPDRSKFDYPPTSTSNLTIESQPGDDTPFIFSPGDTYTVSFTGNGAATIQLIRYRSVACAQPESVINRTLLRKTTLFILSPGHNNIDKYAIQMQFM